MDSAEASTISNRPTAQASLMYATYVDVCLMCCSCYYSSATACISLLGEPGTVCLWYAAWRPVSS